MDSSPDLAAEAQLQIKSTKASISQAKPITQQITSCEAFVNRKFAAFKVMDQQAQDLAVAMTIAKEELDSARDELQGLKDKQILMLSMQANNQPAAIPASPNVELETLKAQLAAQSAMLQQLQVAQTDASNFSSLLQLLQPHLSALPAPIAQQIALAQSPQGMAIGAAISAPTTPLAAQDQGSDAMAFSDPFGPAAMSPKGSRAVPYAKPMLPVEDPEAIAVQKMRELASLSANTVLTGGPSNEVISSDLGGGVTETTFPPTFQYEESP
jgi:hypothetical protein